MILYVNFLHKKDEKYHIWAKVHGFRIDVTPQITLKQAKSQMEHPKDDSLEQTIREESTSVSLPVLTIGSVDRIRERQYRELCIERILEIVLELDNYRGTGRLFVP